MHIILPEHKPITIIKIHYILNLPVNYPLSQLGITEYKLNIYYRKKE
jgi:hypothetical protein